MQNLTRKVIQRLEELGHDMDDVSESAVSSEPEDSEHEVDVDWEIPRKVLHSSIGLFFLFCCSPPYIASLGFFTLYLYVSESPVHCVVRVLWSSLCVIYPADLLRFRYPSFAKLYEKILGFLMRDSEKVMILFRSPCLWHLTMDRIQRTVWYGTSLESTSLFNSILSTWPRFLFSCTPFHPYLLSLHSDWYSSNSLSWADTAASTIGRLYGPSSPRLPSNLYIPHRKFPLVKIPLSPRKSIAGFLVATLTGMIATVGFWGWIAPVRFSGRELSWDFVRGVAMSGVREGAGIKGLSGWTGLSVIGVVAGLVSGVTEAMGTCCGSLSLYFGWWPFEDLGSLDDNLTLPIISGGCILGFLKFVGWVSSSWSRTF